MSKAGAAFQTSGQPVMKGMSISNGKFENLKDASWQPKKLLIRSFGRQIHYYMQTTPLVIIGMHRSGTSLITQWLYRCGLYIGDELMVANGGNEQGYFEDMDFVRLHENLLRGEDLPDTGLTDKSLPELSSEKRRSILRLLEDKDSSHAQWGWKDPRTCLFLPVYRQLIPNAKYLLIYRDYRFCVSSLIRRMLKDKKIDYLNTGKWNAPLRWKWYKKAKTSRFLFHTYSEDFLKVWIHYNKELLSHVETLGRERCPVVNYRFLLSDDKKVFNLLTSHWDFNLTYSSFGDVYNKELMSTEAVIDPYITDKSLITVAEKLESQLQAYALT